MDTALHLRVRSIPVWKRAPFLRLVIPLMTGIIFQWYKPLNNVIIICVISGCLLFLLAGLIVPVSLRFRLSRSYGMLTYVLLVAGGAWLCFKADITHNESWFGHRYKQPDKLIAEVIASAIGTPKNWKYLVEVREIVRPAGSSRSTGRLWLYVRRDGGSADFPGLRLHERLLLLKNAESIRSSGNPGSFDYARYSLFQGITHQVFAGTDEYHLLPPRYQPHRNQVQRFLDLDWLHAARNNILETLTRYVPGSRESGMAEALLIGYRDDLDKGLVDLYADTGVVHIIAISGMHLALVYWLLDLLFRPLGKRRRFKWLPPVLVLTGMWIFTILAGAQPSIVRSAVMFTCIVGGRAMSRKVSIYQSLSLSAFLLLCYNPFWLWDLGFQLSYAAVLSLVVFMKPIYDLLYFRNKLMDLAWQSVAVSLAAQLLTVPLSIYHFHRFPNYFWITNFLAVPLSTIILFAELLLCALFFVPFIAVPLGRCIAWVIRFMNDFVEHVASLPWSVLKDLQISAFQCLLLYLLIRVSWEWARTAERRWLRLAGLIMLMFTGLRSWSFFVAIRQEKLIVYQVNGKSAIDLMGGRQCWFFGDEGLNIPSQARYHLEPARSMFRVTRSPGSFSNLHFFDTGAAGVRVLKADGLTIFLARNTRSIVLSGHQRIDLEMLIALLTSNPVDSGEPGEKSGHRPGGSAEPSRRDYKPSHPSNTHPQVIAVIDSSVPIHLAAAYHDLLARYAITVLDVRTAGAAVIDTNAD